MFPPLLPIIAKKLQLPASKVKATLHLLEQGATIPFIARYRQEATQGLNEVEIIEIERTFKQLASLQKRKASILESLKEQGHLSDELAQKIEALWSATELEDLYLPYKPKRRTKATVARENGLEPLARQFMKGIGAHKEEDLARDFLNKEVQTVDKALQGARYILAEWINENPRARKALRRLYKQEALITAKVVKAKEAEADKYRDYFNFSELLKKIPSHRLLALRRGEAEGFLRVSVAPDSDKALELLEPIINKGKQPRHRQLQLAIADGYKRLLKPSLETEFKNLSKAKADAEAVAVFAENLKQLLQTPPLGPKRILAIDPGFKSGCKVVCLNAQGDLLHNENIYPHPPQKETGRAASKIAQLVEAYKLEAIAIGNGTAGRETEDFISQKVRLNRPVKVYVVNEAGASVYSASKIARQEFPNYDVTVRGAVSIGRRLMDPLAELVKIDPKSIGVGQYQHDVDQNLLKESLSQITESVVNQVGVNVNTASASLLSYVSGVGPKLAENITSHRLENGAFTSRQALKKVPGMGLKAFEQCAGFLRVPGSQNVLDNSAVHPESYPLVKKMAAKLNIDVKHLIGNEKILSTLKPDHFISETDGLLTVKAVLKELQKAGRDPRGVAKVFQFDPNLRKIEDLRQGMVVPGLVSNITNFGAFVDIGVKQDGLIHVSELANRFVSDPNEVVKLQQELRVKVLSVDATRKRIQLSLKQAE
jgi:uncharacterized protein